METRSRGETHVHYRCDPCNRELGAAEIRHIKAGSGSMPTCARCGALVHQEQARTIRPFHVELLHAVARTFTPVPLVIALGIGLLAFVVSFLSRWPIGYAIQAGYFFAVVRAESAGADHPEIGSDDVGYSRGAWLRPAFRYFMTTVVAFMPALLVGWLLGPSGAPVTSGLALAGFVYLPAGLVVSAHDGHGLLTPFDVVTPIRLIARIPGAYFTAFGVLVGLAVVGWVSTLAIGLFEPLVGTVIAIAADRIVGFLPFIAMARVLGTLMHEHREEL
jgi:hypothetical protein